MALSDKPSRQSLIPNFLYSSSSYTRTLPLKKMLQSPPTLDGVSSSPKSFVIPAPSEPSKKIEMYSPAFYAACTFGGILSCGLTHMAVTPLDLVKCNMQVRLAWISHHFSPCVYISVWVNLCMCARFLKCLSYFSDSVIFRQICDFSSFVRRFLFFWGF